MHRKCTEKPQRYIIYPFELAFKGCFKPNCYSVCLFFLGTANWLDSVGMLQTHGQHDKSKETNAQTASKFETHFFRHVSSVSTPLCALLWQARHNRLLVSTALKDLEHLRSWSQMRGWKCGGTRSLKPATKQTIDWTCCSVLESLGQFFLLELNCETTHDVKTHPYCCSQNSQSSKFRDRGKKPPDSKDAMYNLTRYFC